MPRTFWRSRRRSSSGSIRRGRATVTKKKKALPKRGQAAGYHIPTLELAQKILSAPNAELAPFSTKAWGPENKKSLYIQTLDHLKIKKPSKPREPKIPDEYYEVPLDVCNCGSCKTHTEKRKEIKDVQKQTRKKLATFRKKLKAWENYEKDTIKSMGYEYATLRKLSDKFSSDSFCKSLAGPKPKCCSGCSRSWYSDCTNVRTWKKNVTPEVLAKGALKYVQQALAIKKTPIVDATALEMIGENIVNYSKSELVA